jgi:hypothetical protein
MHPSIFPELGEQIDPYVDFIIGLARVDARGLWIPNRALDCGWDVADPEYHLEVMNRRPTLELRSHRARVIRLAKRTIKRDAKTGGVAVLCSWNISALAIELVQDADRTLPDALTVFFAGASADIARRLTPDPSPVVEAIELPTGVSQHEAALRLAEMADHAQEAARSRSKQARGAGSAGRATTPAPTAQCAWSARIAGRASAVCAAAWRGSSAERRVTSDK